ncbi:MAG TPA: Re/Si-specific NAD(P)(+) transhydrogenase subunit alpha [Kofleriaceae bacterium]|nr:Re/Si-specific NAD(P)(+) transhydrogenase subunit alpha [Kofleriaceae bacterium]
MKLGIVKEIRPDERRVAASPTTVARWVKAGWQVVIERGAGDGASYPDRLYQDAGATVALTADEVWAQADVLVKVRPPGERPDGGHEADLARAGQTVISFLFPAQNPEILDKLVARKATALAIDCIPRISRAQKVDALSSMANIAGYRAVVEGATRFGSFFTGQMTAAGKVPPAKVLIIGAGVAGLAAIAAAKGLGAIVRAFDVRPSVADQIKSLGGEFLTVDVAESGEGQGGYAKEMSKEFIDAEMALFRAQAKEVNIVITTALIPGKPAPKLWLTDMVESMKPGSVIVDLAAENGGNCDLTKPGEVVVHHGVSIIGYTDMASRMAHVASELYGTNLWHLLEEMGGAQGFKIDRDNDIVRGALVAYDGEKTWPPPPPKKVEPEVKTSREGALPAPVAAKTGQTGKVPVVPAATAAAKGHGHGGAPSKGLPGQVLLAMLALFVAGFLGLRFGMSTADVGPETGRLLQHLTVFVLAVFVGWQVIWNVTPALHTPLMSVTNAISGIIVVGGLLGGGGALKTAAGDVRWSVVVAVVATLFATINIVGGFWVTRRMLAMFRK